MTDRMLLDALRACCEATANAVNRDTKAAAKREERCYSDLFQLVLGRKPTPAELEHMTGGSVLSEE